MTLRHHSRYSCLPYTVRHLDTYPHNTYEEQYLCLSTSGHKHLVCYNYYTFCLLRADPYRIALIRLLTVHL